jgi:membrane-associated phospholipid phosphatase
LPEASERAAVTDGRGNPPWMAEIGHRFRYRQWLKIAGVCAFMWLFFTGYFHVMRNPAYPVVTLPLTALDHAIPFVPQALVVYLSLWFYVGIPAGLAATLRTAVLYGAWTAGLCVSGLTLFFFWPTAIPRMPIDLADHPAFAVLQGVDAAGNACPSLHVASAVFAAAWIGRILREVQAPPALQVVNLAWCLAIAWSTVAVRQHVTLDVLGGFVLGACFAWLSRLGRSPG